MLCEKSVLSRDFSANNFSRFFLCSSRIKAFFVYSFVDLIAHAVQHLLSTSLFSAVHLYVSAFKLVKALTEFYGCCCVFFIIIFGSFIVIVCSSRNCTASPLQLLQKKIISPYSNAFVQIWFSSRIFRYTTCITRSLMCGAANSVCTLLKGIAKR